MIRLYIQGRAEIRLTQADFKAQGGQGAVYVQGATAYKIYTDPRRMIDAAKIQELSVLARPNLIRPQEILLDEQNRPVGYTMRYVERAFALCRMFPQAFRRRHNLTPDVALRLVRRLRAGVAYVHRQGILIVDLNEMNFLVAEDFGEVFFLDADSYQTRSYPATALMESVRDRHARSWSAASDWFSFAVVSFQMFTGIHPYKGTYPPFQGIVEKEQRLDARMRANISVLRPEVSVPAAALPFSVIPPAYMDWYRAVLEEGKRLPPPDGTPLLLAPSQVRRTAQPMAGRSDLFEIEQLYEFDSDALAHCAGITLTETAVYAGGEKLAAVTADARIAITPRRQHVIVARLQDGEVRFYDATARSDLASGIAAEKLMAVDGRIYAQQRDNLLEIEFVELARSILPRARMVGKVLRHATELFEGVALQNLLGAVYASLLPGAGQCYQARLKELDGYRLIDAKLAGRVLVVVGAQAGVYDKFIFRFGSDFAAYDARIIPDVAYSGINFVALASGVCLHLNEQDELEVFSARPGSAGLQLITGAPLGSDARLFSYGAQALFARAQKLYRFSMRRAAV